MYIPKPTKPTRSDFKHLNLENTEIKICGKCDLYDEARAVILGLVEQDPRSFQIISSGGLWIRFHRIKFKAFSVALNLCEELKGCTKNSLVPRAYY